MDPGIQALTIRPADWAALLDGFVEGLSYELGVLVCLAVLGAVLFAILGRRSVAPAASAKEQAGVAWQPAALGAGRPQLSGSVVLVASGPYAARPGRHGRQCARRRVERRAAVSVSFGPLPY
jgi:hypothetical protein